MANHTVIRLENVSKTFAEAKVPVHALQGVSLEIERGEFTAIVGPSGSGKTTLLNLIGGLDLPSSGKVTVAGEEISSYRKNQLIDFRLHHIGFVFQSYNLIPVLTALENAEFVMMLQGIPYKERHDRAEKLLTHFGLADKLHVRPAELSGGQQQRVAVARALASHPKFILADEPTANLDTASANHLLQLMQELNQQEGMTFLFSTHDSRVISHARRVITLEDGKIISDITQSPSAHS